MTILRFPGEGHTFFEIVKFYSSQKLTNGSRLIAGCFGFKIFLGYSLVIIGPLQLAIHMVQNRHTGMQKSH